MNYSIVAVTVALPHFSSVSTTLPLLNVAINLPPATVVTIVLPFPALIADNTFLASKLRGTS